MFETNSSKTDLENRREHSCLYPMSPQPEGERRTLHQSFSMISYVRTDGIGSSKRVSCGDINAAPWGSLYPVYSAETKQIYKNIECTFADGITDGIHWDALINCPSKKVVSGFIGLESNTIPDECFIYFVYPDDPNDLQFSKCYVPLIDTCPESPEFQIPRDTNLSKNEIVTLCTSGLVSPYQARKMYANVFCHICNSERFSKDVTCNKKYDWNSRDKYTGFIALLDTGFLNQMKSSNRMKEEGLVDVRRACSLEDVSLFRVV